ncbi:hypothetical protein CEXT_520131 [Caerostris extrusa]|uniref:Ycf15 n=1 Tax=Caerostris extrusa TaxID=172846 RepID=A0AAV4N512_CAEEX|nr:hypothetical protein CEXT_520131 [Caerostris extrusa]
MIVSRKGCSILCRGSSLPGRDYYQSSPFRESPERPDRRFNENLKECQMIASRKGCSIFVQGVHLFQDVTIISPPHSGGSPERPGRHFNEVPNYLKMEIPN